MQELKVREAGHQTELNKLLIKESELDAEVQQAAATMNNIQAEIDAIQNKIIKIKHDRNSVERLAAMHNTVSYY